MDLQREEFYGALIESECGKAKILNGHFSCLSSSLYIWGPGNTVRGFQFL